MIKVENVEVFNFEGAFRGIRNPLNSWDKSDSKVMTDYVDHTNKFILGKNDLDLARRLYKAGNEHRKFMRQIFVSMDITCHHTWWAEFDTYKVGVTRNSCSKMHKIHVKEFLFDDFSHEGISEVGGTTMSCFSGVINELEHLRKAFNETHDKKYWRAIIELLPLSYNLRATVTMNYENVINMIHQRNNHKLDEWREFCEVLNNLPYIKEITGGIADESDKE